MEHLGCGFVREGTGVKHDGMLAPGDGLDLGRLFVGGSTVVDGGLGTEVQNDLDV